MLDITRNAEYVNVITGIEYHNYKPYASCTFNNNDEVRIPISQQDVITAPFLSTLHIKGKLTGKNAAGTAVPVKFVNNAIAYLFEAIRYEIGGIVIDQSKNAGITSTIKNYLSIDRAEQDMLRNGCWLGPGETLESEDFSFNVPLKLLLGFAEDFKRIIINVKQELILLRSASDLNAIISDGASTVELNISSICWRIPHITLADIDRLKLYRTVENDTPLHIPFRSWELHEYPTLPQTSLQSWTIKTSSELEKPRYVVLAFQVDRKNNIKKDMSQFDSCKLKNFKLYLNSQYFPYDNVNGDYSIFYDMLTRFQCSYYDTPASHPVIDLNSFLNKTPLYVIDCSKQHDGIKSGPVDVRLEIETDEAFKDKTTAYCLLIHDSHVVYTPLTGTVKRAPL